WTIEGLALSRSNHADEALAAYRRALAVSPGYLPALEGSAEIEYKRDPKQAIGLLKQILAVRPEDATAHSMLAALEYRSKDCPSAVKDFGVAQAGNSDDPLVLGEYGFCLTEVKDYNAAVPVFSRILA